MAKNKCIPPQPKRPRNTVTLNLNGPDVRANFRASQAHLDYWFFCQSPVRVRVGNQIVYTTPTSGTFYYAVTYQGRYVVFVIVARPFWLVGFYNQHGYFQMLWEDRLYMAHPDAQVTRFDGNHGRISGADVEQTKLGCHWTRKGLDAISNYRGPSHPEPEEFRPAIGRFVTLIMESKYREIFIRCCNSFSGNFSQKRLGGEGAGYLVHHWTNISTEAMLRIDQGHASTDDIEDTIETLQGLFILHVDGYNGGIFKHDPLPPPPRDDIWEPIDNGIGDNRIGRPQPRRGSVGAAAKAHRNAGKKTTLDPKNKRAGLRGGGAGGSGEAPKWFVDWLHGKRDKKACDMVVKWSREIGLEIIEGNLFVKENLQSDKTSKDDKESLKNKNQISKENKSPPGSCTKDGKEMKDPPGSSNYGKEKAENHQSISSSKTSTREDHKSPPGSCTKDGKEMKAPPGSSNYGKEKAENHQSSSNSKTSTREDPPRQVLEELQGPNFVSDVAINWFFRHLSDTYGGDGLIEFADADSAYLMAHGSEGVILEFNLDNALCTLFPINDRENQNYGEGEGIHWSLLVLDATGDRPRFVHHDSLAGANSQAAHHLADAIRQVIPNMQEGIVEAVTPLQRNGWDCAVFVMAIARSIARWWAEDGGEGDWMERLKMEVDSSGVTALRVCLVDILRGNLSFEDLEGWL